MPYAAITSDLRDPHGFEEAFAAHRPAMLATARGVLHDQAAAEDVVQDIFIQLWLGGSRYDPARGTLRSFLVMLARSRAVDRWRSRAVARTALERSAQISALDPATDDAADVVIRRDGARAAIDAVTRLPRPQQEAVLLAYGGGFSAREVADATGIPLGTAKSRLRLGLARARESMRDRVPAR